MPSNNYNYNYNDVNYIDTERPPEYSSLITTDNNSLLPPCYQDTVQQVSVEPPQYTVSPLDNGLDTGLDIGLYGLHVPPPYTEQDTDGGQQARRVNNEATLLISTPTTLHTDLQCWQTTPPPQPPPTTTTPTTTTTTTTTNSITSTTTTRRQQQRHLLIVLLCTAVLCNPLFGLVAICLARLDVNRSKQRGFPYNQQSTDGFPYNRRIAVIVSVTGITITVITVVILCSVNALLTTVINGPRTCPSTELLTYNNVTYRYCVPVSSQSHCSFGFYRSAVSQCYYDQRYESTRERFSGHRTCVSPMADLPIDGYCYYSSQYNCPYSTNYINNTCYTFGLRVSEPTACRHGLYWPQTNFCYYQTMHRSRDNKCRDVTADLFAGGFCFSNKHH